MRRLDENLDAGEGQPVQSLRWWLWLEGGARPDVEAREQMGGF